MKRDFQRIYAEERDPWQIGVADGVRYDAYRDLLLGHAAGRRALLDAGCGLGAFLARFEGEFERLTGADVSPRAIEQAAAQHPRIRFLVASIDALAATPLDTDRFDAIICSDVLYYLPEDGRRRATEWIASHLAVGGVALLAAWCPGGNYLLPDELRSLVRRDFRIVEDVEFESGHVALVAERKRRLVALTFDYETWQPIPAGRRIDWDIDVFRPTEALLAACDAERARVTFFAEMGEYLWLRRNDPAVAARMEEQWRDAVLRGHEVALHLHPSWLPELDARREGDDWWWDWTKAKANDYPGDLAALVRECCDAIERAVAPVDASYRVRTFRAGAYQAQPFRRLHHALLQNGIEADSSVYAGGVSAERGYDFSLAWSDAAPYFASPYDPQLKAVPVEQQLIELPIRTFAPGDRWLLDGSEGPRFAARLLADADRRYRRHPTQASLRRRARIRGLMGAAYVRLGHFRTLVNAALPRRVLWLMSGHGPDPSTGHEYHVAIGHTKGDLDVDALAEGIRSLRRDGRFELVTLAEAASVARAELERTARTRETEIDFQVRREYRAVLGDERNAPQSHRLQAMIPLDRERVLDLGCGAGYWTARIADLYPWMDVVGVDAGADFIAQAIERYASARISFERADFLALPFEEASFDCVYADNTLEHAWDVDAALHEIARVLSPGGVLVAAIPSDARNPGRIVDNHNWKAAPHEIELRLRQAGFANVAVDEVDSLRTLGQGPYPPSRDRMAYVRAWKRPRDAKQAERVREAMSWVYRRLDPSVPHTAADAVGILAGGTAFCAGYAVALGELLRRESIDVNWVTMEARGHPRGRGNARIDTHTVVVAGLDGREHLLDPMSNVVIPHPLDAILRNPALVPENPTPDGRWVERGYDLYATAFWYERVRRFQRHDRLNPRVRLWRRAPKRRGQEGSATSRAE